MAIPIYLAMTAAEFASCANFPPHTGWMACHFSSYGLGLSNLPPALPEDAMVIVNDRTPICGHDPETILLQLAGIPCGCYLLDFQRPGVLETARLAEYLLKNLPRPAALSSLYAEDLDCPVFLPPVPPSLSPEDYLQPWQGREIWLEAAMNTEIITVTSQGTTTQESTEPISQPLPHFDEALFCHYAIEIHGDAACFHLHRTREDLAALLQKAEPLGVRLSAGLYQELK